MPVGRTTGSQRAALPHVTVQPTTQTSRQRWSSTPDQVSTVVSVRHPVPECDIPFLVTFEVRASRLADVHAPCRLGHMCAAKPEPRRGSGAPACGRTTRHAKLVTDTISRLAPVSPLTGVGAVSAASERNADVLLRMQRGGERKWRPDTLGSLGGSQRTRIQRYMQTTVRCSQPRLISIVMCRTPPPSRSPGTRIQARSRLSPYLQAAAATTAQEVEQETKAEVAKFHWWQRK